MKTLYICGYGFVENEISLLTLKILSEVDIIVSPSLEESSHILKYIFSLNQTKKIQFKNIRHIDTNKTVVIIKSLFKKYTKIAALFYGNPLFMNSITENLISKLKKVKVVTFPAISSFDYIFHFFPNLNIFTEKITILNNKIFETAYMKKKDINFDTYSHVFIFGAENFKKNSGIKNLFINLFKKHYEIKHKLFLLHISDLTENKKIIKKVTIKNIIENLNNSLMQTLYIPPKKTLSQLTQHQNR
ncbi:MAG: hypothetical protein N2Z20_05025 [Elusimicrobiales bacterium]|nr:hypothetical protein [Elusimicrobiales bacterium]